jgi:hypothetical protein
LAIYRIETPCLAALGVSEVVSRLSSGVLLSFRLAGSHLLMDTTTALPVLTGPLDRCRDEDMRTPDVLAALDFLAARATVKWPFEQFRESLNDTGSQLWEREGRWQVCNASLNGIKLALTGKQSQPIGRRKREWVFEPPPSRQKKR